MSLGTLRMARLGPVFVSDCRSAQITLDLVNYGVWIYGSCKVDAIFHGYNHWMGDCK